MLGQVVCGLLALSAGFVLARATGSFGSWVGVGSTMFVVTVFVGDGWRRRRRSERRATPA
ncbi:hypothetical protein [Cellulomonas sp.]|uniref:hypothetical protein n=1 Tax=Cellulomonas sp. TaxID=40001 RepID=UPI001B2298A0|nr:hypothetical protein [Cellulomonas sp.]MBO9553449.1 hypothetical protein [Cellulomonas sp.]